MKFKSIHPWDVSPVQAINIQKELRQSLESKKWVGMPRLIAGVDVAFRRDLARGAVVVLDYPELKIM
jgi:deoxyribonuclease V